MKTTKSRATSEYIKLIKLFPLAPIKNTKHLKEAYAVVDGLLQRRRAGNLTQQEEDYFDVISTIVISYEDVHYPIKRLSPLETLRDLMEINNLKQADLAHLFSSKSNLSEILSGQRKISKGQARRLSDYFKMSISAFID
ncbi:MAG: hypothetical protein K2X29_10780 [Candidatus Obscuribacterales bacterium]|nr:hypothetical protein [Candidatus Obscuribacterales bacterium]